MTKFRMSSDRQFEMLMDGVWLPLDSETTNAFIPEAILGPLMRGATCVTVTVEGEDEDCA